MNTLTPLKIGSQIRIMRENKKMSQHDLGIEAEIDIKYVGKIERGEVNISVDKLYFICKSLDSKLSEFFDFIDN